MSKGIKLICMEVLLTNAFITTGYLQSTKVFFLLFVVDQNPTDTSDVLFHAVDLEVIKLRSQVPSGTTRTRENFRKKLVGREGERCVWTGFMPGVGMHVIPFGKGDEARHANGTVRPRSGPVSCKTNSQSEGLSVSLTSRRIDADPGTVDAGADAEAADGAGSWVVGQKGGSEYGCYRGYQVALCVSGRL
jgi:hypothetical protein